MAAITAQAVKELRERTDLPMMDCKQALVEADGDQERAVEILKEKHKKIMDKRADNVTAEGVIAIVAKEGGSEAAMVELQCESAPVASNDGFQHLAALCAQQLLNGQGAATPEELLDQPSPTGNGTLKEVWEDLVNRIREKIVLARVIRLEGKIGGYVHHDKKTGVLFQASGEGTNPQILRDVAMHIAALKPTVTNAEDLDQASVAAERERLTAEAKASGKPDNIIEKMVDGRMKNFYIEQGVLVLQPFAKDDTKTVNQALAEHGLKAERFVRWTLGT